MKKTVYLILALLAIIIILLGTVALLLIKQTNTNKNSNNITSFAECVAAGNPVLESYPRQCKTSSGLTFVEVIAASSTPTVTASTPTTTTSPTNAPVNIEVYMFDRVKFDIPSNTDYVSKVNRTTLRKDVATFAIEQIIKGPNASELANNLEATFGTNKFVWFEGESNCAGKDFSLTISSGNADLHFCRTTMLAGDMSGFVIEQQVIKTLKQFSSIQKVRILNVDGNCFNDMKGVTPAECYEDVDLFE